MLLLGLFLGHVGCNFSFFLIKCVSFSLKRRLCIRFLILYNVWFSTVCLIWLFLKFHVFGMMTSTSLPLKIDVCSSNSNLDFDFNWALHLRELTILFTSRWQAIIMSSMKRLKRLSILAMSALQHVLPLQEPLWFLGLLLNTFFLFHLFFFLAIPYFTAQRSRSFDDSLE